MANREFSDQLKKCNTFILRHLTSLIRDDLRLKYQQYNNINNVLTFIKGNIKKHIIPFSQRVLADVAVPLSEDGEEFGS